MQGRIGTLGEHPVGRSDRVCFLISLDAYESFVLKMSKRDGNIYMPNRQKLLSLIGCWLMTTPTVVLEMFFRIGTRGLVN